jgi:hypothetical protein
MPRKNKQITAEDLADIDNLPSLTDSHLEKLDYPKERLYEFASKWSSHYPIFLKGLYDRQITFKVFYEEMRYFGGDDPTDPEKDYEYTDAHEEYFQKLCDENDIHHNVRDHYRPNHTYFCVCGMPIVQNCYVVFRGDEFSNSKPKLVLGNCCVERYIKVENRQKECFLCKKIHENRQSSYCEDCRKKCSKCGEIKNNVVEAGICKKCKNELKRREEEAENRRMLAEIYERDRIQKEQERQEQARKHEEEQRSFQEMLRQKNEQRREIERQEAEQRKKEAEKERIIAEVRRRDMEEQRAIEEYTRKNRCECGAIIKGTYRQCADCFKKMPTCSRVGCNRKISNPKYQLCYNCNRL